MTHSFDVGVAKEFGVHAAVLLSNMEYWIAKNEANGKHQHDGLIWTYNSRKAMEELFPYMSSRQIQYALDKLINEGIIVTGNFNESAYDRTLWYAITKKGRLILQNCQSGVTKLSNDILQNCQMLTDIKPDIKHTDKKPDIKPNICEESDEIISYLNKKTGKQFRANTKSYAKYISARLSEGYTVEDFKHVIDVKCAEWMNTDHEQYLRPDTLFAPSHFDSYLNQKIVKAKPKSAIYFSNDECREQMKNETPTF